MNAPTELRLSRDEFDRWSRHQERKYEWKDGRIVQMNNVTRGHADLVSDLVYALRTRLDRAIWMVAVAEFGVEGRGFVRFPDVLVERRSGDRDRDGRRADAVVLFEVLSPSTVKTDMIEKREEYEQLPTVISYVVLSQDEPILWVWHRDAESGRFPAKPEEISGRGAELPLPAIAATLPLAEIFAALPPDRG